MTSNPIPFISRAFARRKLRRRLHDLRCSVRYTLASDDDILKASAKLELHAIRDAIAMIPKNDFPALEHELPGLETRFQKAMPRPSFALHLRNFLDVLAVAGAVAFGIRALFLQPFQIPTSSMQPTLFGIHYMDAAESAPHRGPLTKFFHPFGASRATVRTQIGGHFQETTQPFSRGLPGLLPFLWDPADAYVSASGVRVGQEHFRLPGDDPAAHIFRYLDTNPLGADFQPGDVVFDGAVSSGDHLFVDRFSIHFLPLKRGEIFIFNTEGLRTSRGTPLTGYYYIKRLVGLPGDTLKILDNVLYIRPKNESEFRRADSFSDRFAKLYSGKGGYQGHNPLGLLANEAELTLPENSYFALGDNTANSLDSRDWGFVPRQNIVGRACFVFWPISRRIGSPDAKTPIDVPTFIPPHTTQPSAMRLQ